LAGILTKKIKEFSSQLRDSVGFSPIFPRFLQRLFLFETKSFKYSLVYHDYSLDISKNYSYRLVVRALALILGTIGDVY
jgi:hypothetical protein